LNYCGAEKSAGPLQIFRILKKKKNRFETQNTMGLHYPELQTPGTHSNPNYSGNIHTLHGTKKTNIPYKMKLNNHKPSGQTMGSRGHGNIWVQVKTPPSLG
jgi:hypothetical protein